MAIPIVSVIGWHNVGKTTFIERLVMELKQRGLRIATVKHTRGDFQLDREETDTWRYAQAGSDVIAIAGRDRFALIERIPEELSLDALVARLPQNLDLIITEGFKQAPTLKIEVIAADQSAKRIARPGELLALVSESPPAVTPDVPCFTPTDAAGMADLLEARGILRGRPQE